MKPALLATTLLMLAACASTEATAPVSPSRSAGLPPQTLLPGECALFLWTTDIPRTLVVFIKADPTLAKMSVSGEEVGLIPVRQDGRLFGQFMTNMTYRDPSGSLVRLDLTPGDMLENGQRISNGQLTIRASDGWDTLVPVVGLRACQPETGE